MAEYINRRELLDNLNKFAPEHYNGLINMLIRNQPTADVVEVVRCKDCKYFYADTYNGKVLQRECRLRSIGCGIGSVRLESETDFCSCGERKDT